MAQFRISQVSLRHSQPLLLFLLEEETFRCHQSSDEPPNGHWLYKSTWGLTEAFGVGTWESGFDAKGSIGIS